MRGFLYLLIPLVLTGCVTAKVGTSIDEFKSTCKTATWQEAAEFRLTTGEIIVGCPLNAYAMQYQLFESGVIKRLISTDEAVAMLEHDRCLSFGAAQGSSDYMNCRLSLAQMRAQQQANAAAQQQQASQALLLYGAALQNMNRPATPTTVNVQANCTAHQQGAYTSYTCR